MCSSDLFLLIGMLSGLIADVSQDFPLVRGALISVSLCGCGRLGCCGRRAASLDGPHTHGLLLAAGGCVGVREYEPHHSWIALSASMRKLSKAVPQSGDL